MAEIDDLKEGLARLQNSEACSDCTVTCGPYHFKLHKAILITHSEYFETAFKTGTFKEGQSGVIELKATDPDSNGPDNYYDACDDPEIVKLMIEYFYHLNYLHRVPSSVAQKPHLIEHAKVFAMAVKYHIKGLRKLAVIKFRFALSLHWDHEDLVEAIRIVYDSTPDDATELRDMVADTIDSHLDKLKENDNVEDAIRSIGALAYELLQRARETKRKEELSFPQLKTCSRSHQFSTQNYQAMFCQFCRKDSYVCSICATIGATRRCLGCGV